jgi:hypothetical protein
MKHLLLACLATAATLAALPAHAQTDPSSGIGLSGGIELSSDERRRGISWSDGDISPSADVAAGLLGLETSARVSLTRDAGRHADADAVFDLEAGTSLPFGLVTLRPYATAHLFTGARGKMDYVEVGADARFTLGPVQLQGGLAYAPDQDAIGGDNLYVSGGASAGIPATPFSVAARIGHSSGSVDDPLRAARLRPGGSYTDWRIGVEHTVWPLTLGVDYTGTDIDRDEVIASPYADRRHTGDKLIARARLSF